jgi:hypothetical protein
MSVASSRVRQLSKHCHRSAQKITADQIKLKYKNPPAATKKIQISELFNKKECISSLIDNHKYSQCSTSKQQTTNERKTNNFCSNK